MAVGIGAKFLFLGSREQVGWTDGGRFFRRLEEPCSLWYLADLDTSIDRGYFPIVRSVNSPLRSS